MGEGETKDITLKELKERWDMIKQISSEITKAELDLLELSWEQRDIEYKIKQKYAVIHGLLFRRGSVASVITKTVEEFNKMHSREDESEDKSRKGSTSICGG